MPLPAGGDAVLAVEPAATADLSGLDGGALTCLSSDAAAHKALAARGLATVPDAAAAPGDAALAIAYLDRDRRASLARIATALRLTAPGGWVLVDGQKTDGADATLKQLRTVLQVDGIAARDHGKVAWLRRPDPLPPAVADWERAGQPERNRDGFLAPPGAFSADGVDPATRMLSDLLPADAKGRAADFGAGWGALSAALLARAPGIVALDLFETDLAALNAAKANVTDPRAAFHWADVTALQGGRYDLIVTNPPFHGDGRKPDPALGAAFIRAAARNLAPGGRLLLVANRQLPYERTLSDAFADWSEVQSDGRFKVISAGRPKSSRRKA